MSVTTTTTLIKSVQPSHQPTQVGQAQAEIERQAEIARTGLANEQTRLLKARELVGQIEARLASHQRRLELATDWLALADEQKRLRSDLAQQLGEQTSLQELITQADQERTTLVGWLATATPSSVAAPIVALALAPAAVVAEFGATSLELEVAVGIGIGGEPSASISEESLPSVAAQTDLAEVSAPALDLTPGESEAGVTTTNNNNNEWSSIIPSDVVAEAEFETDGIAQAEEEEEATPVPIAFSLDDFEVSDEFEEGMEVEEAAAETAVVELEVETKAAMGFTQAATLTLASPHPTGSPPTQSNSQSQLTTLSPRRKLGVSSNSKAKAKAPRPLVVPNMSDRLKPRPTSAKPNAALLAGD